MQEGEAQEKIVPLLNWRGRGQSWGPVWRWPVWGRAPKSGQLHRGGNPGIRLAVLLHPWPHTTLCARRRKRRCGLAGNNYGEAGRGTETLQIPRGWWVFTRWTAKVARPPWTLQHSAESPERLSFSVRLNQPLNKIGMRRTLTTRRDSPQRDQANPPMNSRIAKAKPNNLGRKTTKTHSRQCNSYNAEYTIKIYRAWA